MRLLLFIPFIFFLFRCELQEEKSADEMLHGKWMLISVDDEPVETRAGYEFAPNKQYFTVDSQGKPISKLMERVWSIDGDTLKLVDFNWEPEFIDEKGTIHYEIKEISDSKLKVKRIKGDDKKGLDLEYEKL